MERVDLMLGRKAGSMIGMPVYCLDHGKRLGSVKDVVYDSEQGRLVAFTLEERGLISPDRRVLLFEKVKSIGRDAIMIESEGLFLAEKDAPEIAGILRHKSGIMGRQVITSSGNVLGSISDVLIDENSGSAISYEVSGGFTSDIASGRSYVPAAQMVIIGEDALVVPDETETMLAEQAPGGLAGTYEEARGRVGEFAGSAADYAREQEIRLARGKTAGKDVSDDQGNLIVAKGEKVTDEVIALAVESGKLHQVAIAAGAGAGTAGYEAARERFYSSTGERLKGRRVPHDIRDDTGMVVIPAGTVVTDETIRLARENGVTGRLSSDVLGEHARAFGEEARTRTTSIWGEARERLSETWSDITERGRESADRAGRKRAEAAQKEFLKGKIADADVKDAHGNVLLRKGEVITPLILDTLAREGRLEDVKVKAEARVTAGRGEPEHELHVILESEKEHRSHKPA